MLRAHLAPPRDSMGWRSVTVGLLLALAVTLLAVPLQQPMLRLLAPAWVAVVEQMAPEFRVTSLAARTATGGTIEAEMRLMQSLIVAQRVLVPETGHTMNVQTPGGLVWSALTVFIVVFFAWPTTHRRPCAVQAARFAVGAVRTGTDLVVGSPGDVDGRDLPRTAVAVGPRGVSPLDVRRRHVARRRTPCADHRFGSGRKCRWTRPTQ